MGACCTMLEVDRMGSIQIRLGRYAIRVAIPESERCVICWEVERIGVFSKPVNISIGRDTTFDADVLRLEDKWIMAG